MEVITQNITVLLLLLFLVITFLQSGIDKMIDWKGNLDWLTGHFSQTPFKKMVPLMLFIVLVMEVLAGLFSGIGFVQILLSGESVFAFFGGVLACITLLMLLFGQRMAKDYEGAKTIVIYFIPAILLVFLLQY
ncbi:DoxX family protein [uncultured Muriicola sp.]|uniref:DoxX family protein n=1 Tax=uncultured Muriicola sp. TaxID=1583102 RepID=UPI002614E41A|nr:DoxX family protein [uncultured Muriicola sp.]